MPGRRSGGGLLVAYRHHLRPVDPPGGAHREARAAHKYWPGLQWVTCLRSCSSSSSSPSSSLSCLRFSSSPECWTFQLHAEIGTHSAKLCCRPWRSHRSRSWLGCRCALCLGRNAWFDNGYIFCVSSRRASWRIFIFSSLLGLPSFFAVVFPGAATLFLGGVNVFYAAMLAAFAFAAFMGWPSCFAVDSPAVPAFREVCEHWLSWL